MKPRDYKEKAKQALQNNWGLAIGVTALAGAISALAGSEAGIAALIVAGPLSLGLTTFFLGLARRGEAPFKSMFRGFAQNFWQNLLLGVLVELFTFLWSLLFIVPGIIKSYAYSMTFFIQHDHPEMRWTDAINASRRMMRGHKWELFVLDLSFLGWILLCILTFGVLSIYVLPYQHAAHAAFYEYLLAHQGAPETAVNGDSEDIRRDSGLADGDIE